MNILNNKVPTGRFLICGLAASLLLATAFAAAPPRSSGPTAERLKKPARMTIDPAGVLLIDDEKVFPITLTVTPPPEAKAPSGKHAYQEFREGGALFMRSGGPKWDDKLLETEWRLQQTAAKYGMRCSPWLGWDLANIKPGDTAKEQRLREVINRLRTSPGMGLWKGADEPEWGKVPPDNVANTARIIHELDPDHPIWLVQAPRGTVESLKRYDAGWDIGGIDIYPISYPPGRHTVLTNKELSMVGDFTRMIREVAGTKPFWMTLQIAFSGSTPPKAPIRFPTFFDQRFMVYEAIINGSRGLTFFGGGIAATLNERDRNLGWNWTYWERVLRPLLQEFVPGSPSYEALLAPDSNIRITTTRASYSPAEKETAGKLPETAGNIEWAVRETPNGVYVFVCKKGYGPTIKVRFDGLPRALSKGDVLFEEPRQVETKDGSFTDWFAPWDVHVYRFR